MSIIEKMLVQDAVYWANPEDIQEPLSIPEFDNPVDIKCRLELAEGATVDPISYESIEQSVVYVDRDVDVGGYLYFGPLKAADLGVVFPPDVEGAHRISGFRKVPDLRGKRFLRIATLGAKKIGAT